jgi:hypothetical protein
VTSVTTERKDKTRLFTYALLRIIEVRLTSLLFIIVNVVPPAVNKMLTETDEEPRKYLIPLTAHLSRNKRLASFCYVYIRYSEA